MNGGATRRASAWTAWLLAIVALSCPATRARAELERRDHGLGPGLSLTVLGGYPRNTRTCHTGIALGLVLHNAGPERTVGLVSQGELRWQHEVRVPRGETVRQFLHLPTQMYQDGGPVQVLFQDGLSGTRKLVTFDSGTESTGKQVIGRLGELSTPMNVSDPWQFVGALDAHWPDTWRALAGLRVIVTELRQLTAHPERQALLGEWVSAGGILVVTAPAEAIDAAPAELVPGAFSASTETRGYGRLQRIGFGAVVLSVPDYVYEVGEDFLDRLELGGLGGWHGDLDQAFDFDARSAQLRKRLPGVAGVPTWTLFGAQLLFALLVGPVGHRFWIGRRRQPFGYVLFALGISLLFSVGMLGADLLDSGLRPVVNVHSALLVDQRTGLELGASDSAVFAPTGLGTGLRAPAGAELVVYGTRVDAGAAAVYSRMESDQHLDGAITSRTLKLFGDKWIGPSRGRLVIEPDGQALRIENHFGAALLDLSVWRAGRRYDTARLEPGQGVKLEGHEVAGDTSGMDLPEPEGELPRHLRSLWRRIQAGELGDAHYQARSAGPPSEAARLEGATRALGTQQHLIAGVF